MLETILVYLPNNFIGFFLLLSAFILGLVLTFAIKKSEWIIYGLLVWFPLESLVLMYTPIRYFAYVKYIPEVIMYGLVVGAFIYFLKKKGRILPRQPLNKWIIGFVIVGIISLVLNWYSTWIWALGMRHLLRFVFMLFVILWMGYDKHVLKKILIFGAAMISLEVFFGLIQYLSGGYLDRFLFSSRAVTIGNAAILAGLDQFWVQGSRVFATMGRYDRLGSFVVIGLLMMFPFLFSIKREKEKILYFLMAFLGLIVLYLTQSRASWIAAFMGFVTVGAILRRDKRVMAVMGLFVAIVVVYLVGFAIINTNVLSISDKPNQTLAERMFESFSFQGWRDSYDGYGRIFFIINTPRMVVSQHPFFGVGPGQYGGGVASALLHTDVYDRLHLPFGIQNIYGQIDNNWLSIWGEVGTLGLIMWIGFFVTIIKMSCHVRKNSDNSFEKLIAEGLVGLTVGMMAIGFFGPYYEFRSLMFYYWTIVGIVALMWHHERNKGNILNAE